MHDILKRAAQTRLLICDIDGVFTDGTLYLTPQGEEFKPFCIHDGLGIKLLLHSGVEVAVITSRISAIIQKRMASLGIKHIYQGQEDKLPSYKAVLEKLALTDSEVAYVGDDLPDLPLIKRAGLGIGVANAVDLVKQHAHWLTNKVGGQGAIREVCELIMRAQDTLSKVQEKYLS